MQKKNKETDLIDNQSDKSENECFVDSESEEDGEIF
jgi:hypothetical protein